MPERWISKTTGGVNQSSYRSLNPTKNWYRRLAPLGGHYSEAIDYERNRLGIGLPRWDGRRGITFMPRALGRRSGRSHSRPSRYNHSFALSVRSTIAVDGRFVSPSVQAQHPLRAPNVAFRILFTSSPRRPISYTFVGSLGCRDRRAVWLDRAPADINNIAGAVTRR